MFRTKDLCSIALIELEPMTIDLSPGKFHVLMGRNGAGKSRLLHILSTQNFFDLNYAAWNGKSLGGWSIGPDRQVAPIDDSLANHPLFTLEDLILIHQDTFENNFHDWKAEIQKTYNCDLELPLNRISQSQMACVLFELALLRKPQLLVLDELPFPLDASAWENISEKLRTFLTRGGTVVVATNNSTEWSGIADQFHVCEP